MTVLVPAKSGNVGTNRATRLFLSTTTILRLPPLVVNCHHPTPPSWPPRRQVSPTPTSSTLSTKSTMQTLITTPTTKRLTWHAHLGVPRRQQHSPRRMPKSPGTMRDNNDAHHQVADIAHPSGCATSTMAFSTPRTLPTKQRDDTDNPMHNDPPPTTTMPRPQTTTTCHQRTTSAQR